MLCGNKATAIASCFWARASSTMRQVTLRGPGNADALVLEHVPFRPQVTLTDGQVTVKVAACGVAYRDIIDRSGGFPFMQRPTVIGHEIAGVVESAAADSELQVGDRVVSLHWAQYSGEAALSPFGHEQAMKTFLGLTVNGGYSDFVTTHHSSFVKVPSPEKWTPIEAAPVMSTFGTVWQGAVVRGSLREGERVLVTGASGGVGSAAVAMASRLGCHVTAATGDADKKGGHIRSCGADDVIDAASGFSRALQKSGGVDMAIECVGAPTFMDSLRSLRPGGRLVLIGNVSNSTAELPLGLCIVKSLSVIGTDSIEAPELCTLFKWMDEQRLRPIVELVLPLEDASKAHLLLENRQVSGRIVLDVNKGIW